MVPVLTLTDAGVLQDASTDPSYQRLQQGWWAGGSPLNPRGSCFPRSRSSGVFDPLPFFDTITGGRPSHSHWSKGRGGGVVNSTIAASPPALVRCRLIRTSPLVSRMPSNRWIFAPRNSYGQNFIKVVISRRST